MEQRDLRRRLRAAVSMVFARDGRLLEYAAGERAVVAKLTTYLMPLFRDFDVDMEYNRHGVDPKDVDLPAGCRGKKRRRIYPDIIVHRRGHDRANLLVVEVKKETNLEPRSCDRGKIEAMKREFGYQCGVLLTLPAGKGATERQPTEGYAAGLGKPVIYTCEQSAWDKRKTHFDTNHHLHIVWDASNMAPAIRDLKATIRFTIPEAKQQDDE